MQNFIVYSKSCE